MNKYKDYITHLNGKIDILQTSYDKKCAELSDLHVENIRMEDRIDNLTLQIDDLEETATIIRKYSNQQFVKKKNKKLLIKNLLYWGISGILGMEAYNTLSNLNSKLNIVIYGIAGALGITIVGYGVSNLIYDLKELSDNKKIAKENNIEDVQLKINRKKKQQKKLSESLKRNRLKVVTLTEKTNILYSAIKDFNALKNATYRLSQEALDYAKEVHGYYIHSKHPKYYENTINQRFKEDERIKDIMIRERKLENDN